MLRITSLSKICTIEKTSLSLGLYLVPSSRRIHSRCLLLVVSLHTCHRLFLLHAFMSCIRKIRKYLIIFHSKYLLLLILTVNFHKLWISYWRFRLKFLWWRELTSLRFGGLNLIFRSRNLTLANRLQNYISTLLK